MYSVKSKEAKDDQQISASFQKAVCASYCDSKQCNITTPTTL